MADCEECMAHQMGAHSRMVAQRECRVPSSALVGVAGSHQSGWLRRMRTSSRQLEVRPCSAPDCAPLKPRLLPPNRYLQVWMPALVSAVQQSLINPFSDVYEHGWVPSPLPAAHTRCCTACALAIGPGLYGLCRLCPLSRTLWPMALLAAPPPFPRQGASGPTKKPTTAPPPT